MNQTMKPLIGGFNQPLPDCCESNESPNAVNIDENPDQLESNSASANAGDECSSLPAMGPYDLGALRTSFSSGALSDQDKYKVLKQFDQPQGYRFPAVSEGGKFGALVESPLTKFKKALETLASHEKTEYHKDSYAKMVAFLESASKGIALRGHRDDAKYLEDTDLNPGNYQALLKFRCGAGDTVLAEHLSKCAKNATYRSKTTQNDIIDILGDEVQDVASIEQITFVLRYVHHEGESYVVKESFAGFKEQHREMTGEAVASTILQKLDELGLNCDNLRGQGYDGSGSMAGIRKGASSIVLQKYPLATYIHCCSHILNLSIASSCSVVLVRNMMGTVSEVSKFFEHGKRQDKLEEVIESELPEVRKKRVKPLCRTRWVERHDSLEVFVELYPAIIGALSDIAYGKDSVSWNRETTSDANGLLSAIEKFSFLLALVVVYNILSYIKGLTVLLQQRSIDIVQGITLVQEVLGQLKELREELDDWNKIWFQMAVEIAEEVGTEKPSIPRMCSRQTQRSNVEADIPEVYYRRSLTAPFLDHFCRRWRTDLPQMQK
eukprot:Em0015g533a